jgi:hypothetical protein
MTRSNFYRSTLILICFASFSCSHVKVVETHTDGGTLKYRKRGLTKESREDKSYAEADQHCKTNGYKTYKVESQVEDGRFMLVRYKCEN